MKKNAIIYIDDTHAQVTKAFEKQARIFGTPEYREWRAYRQDFPTAQMVTKTHQQAHLQESDLRQHGAVPEHAAQWQGAYQRVQRSEGNRRHPAESLPRGAGLVPCQVPQVRRVQGVLC